MNKLNKILLTLGCALSFTGSINAQVNTNFQFVSFWQLTNYINGIINSPISGSNLVIGSGLLASTNSINSNITITTNGIAVTIANGGTGVSDTNSLAVLVRGSLSKLDNSYFADTTPSNTNVANIAAFPVAQYPGQMLMTYGPGIGGQIAGQLFFSGNDLSWRRDLQLGYTSIFANDTGGTQALLVKAGNGTGIDNPITLLNADTNHYSAIRWLDSFSSEQGAMGFGNVNVPFYRGINYFEDNQNRNGFYFTGSRNVMGGLEKTTGDFVWYQGNSISSNNPFAGLTQIFRIQRSSGVISGNGSGLTGIIATATNGTASVDDAGYFADHSHNTVANISAFPPAAFPGQMLMTYDSTIGGSVSGQLFFAGADKSWRRDIQVGRTSILSTAPNAAEALLVKQTNATGNTITMQSIDSATFSAIDWLDAGGSEKGAVGFGNSSVTNYRGVNYIDDSSDANGFYFTGASSLNGGSLATNGNFVWFTGTSTSSNSPYTGLSKSFEINRTNGSVNTYVSSTNFGSSVENVLQVTNFANITNLTAGKINMAGLIKLSSDLAWSSATTNIPVSTNAPKYYITVTNNNAAGYIPIYQ